MEQKKIDAAEARLQELRGAAQQAAEEHCANFVECGLRQAAAELDRMWRTAQTSAADA